MAEKEPSLLGIVEIPRRQAQVMLDAAYFYMEMGKFKEAEEVFEGCAALLPRSEVPLMGLGHLYVSQEKFDKAIETYQKALKVKPDSAEVHAFLGEAYLLKGEAEKALPILQKAQELDKNDPPTAGALAKSLLQAYQEGILPPKR